MFFSILNFLCKQVILESHIVWGNAPQRTRMQNAPLPSAWEVELRMLMTIWENLYAIPRTEGVTISAWHSTLLWLLHVCTTMLIWYSSLYTVEIRLTILNAIKPGRPNPKYLPLIVLSILRRSCPLKQHLSMNYSETFKYHSSKKITSKFGVVITVFEPKNWVGSVDR